MLSYLKTKNTSFQQIELRDFEVDSIEILKETIHDVHQNTSVLIQKNFHEDLRKLKIQQAIY